MFKEIILAVILGTLLGFGITGGYLATQKRGVSTTPPTTSQNSTLDPTSTPDTPATNNTAPLETIIPTPSLVAGQLAITSPADEDIVTNSLLSIKGQTVPGSTVVINTAQKHFQTTADTDGNFQTDIELESGLNNIQIDSFSPTQEQSSVSLQVTYSTAKI